jgi:hypothetical protein
MKYVRMTASRMPVKISATSVACSATSPSDDLVRLSNSSPMRSRTLCASAREMSNGPPSTSQSSMSSTASVSVGPIASASPANDRTASVTSASSTTKNTTIEVIAAKPGRHRWRCSHPETGDNARVRNSAITTGKNTTRASRRSHSAARATMLMTIRRHEYAASRSRVVGTRGEGAAAAVMSR